MQAWCWATCLFYRCGRCYLVEFVLISTGIRHLECSELHAGDHWILHVAVYFCSYSLDLNRDQTLWLLRTPFWRTLHKGKNPSYQTSVKNHSCPHALHTTPNLVKLRGFEHHCVACWTASRPPYTLWSCMGLCMILLFDGGLPAFPESPNQVKLHGFVTCCVVGWGSPGTLRLAGCTQGLRESVWVCPLLCCLRGGLPGHPGTPNPVKLYGCVWRPWVWKKPARTTFFFQRFFQMSFFFQMFFQMVFQIVFFSVFLFIPTGIIILRCCM